MTLAENNEDANQHKTATTEVAPHLANELLAKQQEFMDTFGYEATKGWPYNQDVPPFDFIVFGGRGDLALRKLLPALYYREFMGKLPLDARIIGVARQPYTRAEYVELVANACRKYIKPADFTDEIWQKFSQRLDYLSLDVTDVASLSKLQEKLHNREETIRVFYLAVSPELYGDICTNLKKANLITDLSRVVLEKPLGHDLESARYINDIVQQAFLETQIFRIDHYLGKEAVQNLLILRFANFLFEPIWNSKHIDHVQISVAESIGVENRLAYYEKAGALRDIVQNHILQLLCLVAMEPPSKLSSKYVRDEKLKVLHALRPLKGSDVNLYTVRGQYKKGIIGDEKVLGYRDELGKESNNETFVALKALVDNWRFANVPFYLRTGKRLPMQCSEIVIQFAKVPHNIFPESVGEIIPNRLVIRLQPNEGIKLQMMHKIPGSMRIMSTPLNLSFADTFARRSPDAYERLLLDVVRGNATLFMRRDEVDAAWMWIDHIREAWQEDNNPVALYAAGNWGPTSAIALIERDGRTWYEEP